LSAPTFTLGTYAENLTLAGKVNGIGNKFANVLTGSDLANTLDGGIGADRLIGGGRDDTLAGGRDVDSFVFKPGFGQDTITDFRTIGADHDIVEFDANIFANADAVFGHSSDTAAGVLIVVDTANTLLLKNTTLAELLTHPEDFHFV
jgi:Ca2+-binding RTX toxin-like protein